MKIIVKPLCKIALAFLLAAACLLSLAACGDSNPSVTYLTSFRLPVH